MIWAVFLDRDGVLNRSNVRDGRPYAPTSLSEFEFLPGVAEALDVLRQAGARLIVATNQPDVGAGRVHRSVVEAMHDRVLNELPVSDIRVCYHTSEDGCDCRKPKPGMLLDAAKENGIDIARSYMVGDRWRDIGAGVAAGCRTVFIDLGYLEKRPEQADRTVASLPEAAAFILEDHQRRAS